MSEPIASISPSLTLAEGGGSLAASRVRGKRGLRSSRDLRKFLERRLYYFDIPHLPLSSGAHTSLIFKDLRTAAKFWDFEICGKDSIS